MKASKVYGVGEFLGGNREHAWQVFYDAAGLLGINLASSWRDYIDDDVARHCDPTDTISMHPPRVEVEAYDPATSYGGRGLR